MMIPTSLFRQLPPKNLTGFCLGYKLEFSKAWPRLHGLSLSVRYNPEIVASMQAPSTHSFPNVGP